MLIRDRPVRKAVVSDVSCYKAVGTQSVHEFAHQARHPLLPSVRPVVNSFSSTSSLVIRSCK